MSEPPSQGSDEDENYEEPKMATTGVNTLSSRRSSFRGKKSTPPQDEDPSGVDLLVRQIKDQKILMRHLNRTIEDQKKEIVDLEKQLEQEKRNHKAIMEEHELIRNSEKERWDTQRDEYEARLAECAEKMQEVEQFLHEKVVMQDNINQLTKRIQDFKDKSRQDLDELQRAHLREKERIKQVWQQRVVDAKSSVLHELGDTNQSKVFLENRRLRSELEFQGAKTEDMIQENQRLMKDLQAHRVEASLNRSAIAELARKNHMNQKLITILRSRAEEVATDSESERKRIHADFQTRVHTLEQLCAAQEHRLQELEMQLSGQTNEARVAQANGEAQRSEIQSLQASLLEAVPFLLASLGDLQDQLHAHHGAAPPRTPEPRDGDVDAPDDPTAEPQSQAQAQAQPQQRGLSFHTHFVSSFFPRAPLGDLERLLRHFLIRLSRQPFAATPGAAHAALLRTTTLLAPPRLGTAPTRPFSPLAVLARGIEDPTGAADEGPSGTTPARPPPRSPHTRTPGSPRAFTPRGGERPSSTGSFAAFFDAENLMPSPPLDRRAPGRSRDGPLAPPPLLAQMHASWERITTRGTRPTCSVAVQTVSQHSILPPVSAELGRGRGSVFGEVRPWGRRPNPLSLSTHMADFLRRSTASQRR